MAALAKLFLRNFRQNRIISPTAIFSIPKQQFSTSDISLLKEIKQTTDNNVTKIEGVYKKSERDGRVLNLGGPDGACPLCKLNMEIKYTDVLILSQFLRPDGCILPRSVTHLCKFQQEKVINLVHQAQRAGLMPNLRPEKRDGKERTHILNRYKWRKYHVYFSDNYQKL